MARYPKPSFKKARGVWYVEIHRKQINLGPDREEAFCKYHELMAEPHQPSSVVGQSGTFPEIVDAFLDWTLKNRSPDTYEWYRYRLQRFISKYPDLDVDALRPFHLENWVDEFDIGQTSSRNYFRSVSRCMNWAKRQGRIERDPLEGVETPSADRKDVYIPPEELEHLLQIVRDDRFRDLLITTYQTGCRPQESLRIISEWVDVTNARWVFPGEKSKGKKSPRIVYLNDQSLEISKRLSKLNRWGISFATAEIHLGLRMLLIAALIASRLAWVS